MFWDLVLLLIPNDGDASPTGEEETKADLLQIVSKMFRASVCQKVTAMTVLDNGSPPVHLFFSFTQMRMLAQ